MNTLALITPLLAAISGDALISAIIWIVIAALIYFVVMWGIEKVGIPEPFHKIAVALVVLVVVVLLCNALLSIAGRGFIRF